MNAYHEALLALQAELPIIERRLEAEVQTAKGTYRYSYADLAAIWREVGPLFDKHRFSYNARVRLGEDGRLALICVLRHVPSGESEESVWPLRADAAPQSLGGSITFYRRYGLCAMAGIITEDDDDAAAAQADAHDSRGTAQRARPQQQTRRTADTGRPTAQRARPPTGDRALRSYTDGGEHYDGQPPLPGDPELVSREHLTRLAILFGEAGVADRDERLLITSKFVGRQLESAKDLTKNEAKRVDALVEQAKAEQNPRVFLHEQVDATAAARIDDGTVHPS